MLLFNHRGRRGAEHRRERLFIVCVLFVPVPVCVPVPDCLCVIRARARVRARARLFVSCLPRTFIIAQ
jgi:hypothetical protein